jgi:hypothetical protein
VVTPANKEADRRLDRDRPSEVRNHLGKDRPQVAPTACRGRNFANPDYQFAIGGTYGGRRGCRRCAIYMVKLLAGLFARPWADCITNMPGFSLRQAQACLIVLIFSARVFLV